MKKVFVCSAIMASINIFLTINLLWAADIYVDPSLSNNCTSGNYSATNQSCNGADGNAYRNVQDAVNSMSGGDDIYLRGGNYGPTQLTGSSTNGAVHIPQSKDGSSINWSSIQSYPGEWAVLDGDDWCVSGGVLGHRDYDKDGSDDIKYWKFERLEITGGAAPDGNGANGLFVNGGPFIVRYCYIHDNVASEGGANPAGIKGMIWHDSIVEYNYFKDNGSNGSVNERHSACGLQIHSDYRHTVDDWETAPYDINHARTKNEIRYNLFENTKDYARYAIHGKGRQYLAHKTDVTWDYKEYGGSIHHNIFIDFQKAIVTQTDFMQIHHNIVTVPAGSKGQSGISVTEAGLGGGNMACVVYNNTIINGRIPHNFGFGEYVVNPYAYVYNNLIDQAPSNYDGMAVINLGHAYMVNPFIYDSTRIDVTNNYLYRGNSTDIKVTRNSGDGYGYMPLSDYDSFYNKTNFSKTSSETTDPIYEGSTGAGQYITKGSHVVSGSKTIINSGKGGSHPYLSGITIPSYIGATDPNDNGWVASVLSLSNPDILKTAQADSAWEEGDDSQATVDELPGDVEGLKITMD